MGSSEYLQGNQIFFFKFVSSPVPPEFEEHRFIIELVGNVMPNFLKRTLHLERVGEKKHDLVFIKLNK